MEINEIVRIYGTEYKEMTMTLLEQVNLKSRIKKGMRIGIKPNLVSCTPAEYGATTHPEVVEGLVEYLQKYGFDDIKILEGSWIGDATEEAFEYCGFKKISEKYGIRLVDEQKDSFYAADCAGMKLNICSEVSDTDFLINVPVLKGHCQTKVTCALKNMKGLIPNSEKRRFHTLGLHEPIAHLNTHIKQDFILIDHICGDWDFEDGGNPRVTNCVMAAVDPVLVDAFACSILSVDISDVPYIKRACELGVGECNLSRLKLTTLNEEYAVSQDDFSGSIHEILDIRYAAEEVESCSACYAGLLAALMRLHDEDGVENIPFKINIGQGFRQKTGKFGVGNCTGKFLHTVKGCPPSVEDIYMALKNWIEGHM